MNAEQLIKKIKTLESQKIKSEVEYNHNLELLKKQFKVNTIKEANKLYDSLCEEIKELQKELSIEIEAFEKDYEEELKNM